MIKVECLARVYEVDGCDTDIADPTSQLIVRSHWNRNEMVVLQLPGSETTYTVLARDLDAAIANATNTRRI